MHTEVETAQPLFPHESPALFRVLFTKAKNSARIRWSMPSSIALPLISIMVHLEIKVLREKTAADCFSSHIYSIHKGSDVLVECKTHLSVALVAFELNHWAGSKVRAPRTSLCMMSTRSAASKWDHHHQSTPHAFKLFWSSLSQLSKTLLKTNEKGRNCF